MRTKGLVPGCECKALYWKENKITEIWTIFPKIMP
jgi:hypothetical protein